MGCGFAPAQLTVAEDWSGHRGQGTHGREKAGARESCPGGVKFATRAAGATGRGAGCKIDTPSHSWGERERGKGLAGPRMGFHADGVGKSGSQI